MQLSDNGDVLFQAALQRGVSGVTAANDDGIWLRQRTGQIYLVAREGDLLDVAPGPAVDLRQMTYVDSVGTGNTRQRHSLTNNGEALFFATFSDNSSGLFLTAAIPEPTTLILSVLSIPATLCPRRSRTHRFELHLPPSALRPCWCLLARK